MKRFLLIFSFLITLCSLANASIYDGKYSQNQVFDVWRSGCYSTGGACSVGGMQNPYIAPYTNWTPMSWASGDYVQFYDAGNGQIGLKQFSSDGTFKQIISNSGYVQAIGSGIVYIGIPSAGGGTGYFISNSQGFAYGSSTTVTNIIAGADITTSVLNNYSASTTPLAAGQTAAPAGPPPPAPTAIYRTSSGVYITRAIPTTSNSPSNEGPLNAFDNNSGTKYLNFDKKNAGVTVQLNAGRAVTGFTVTTANDFSGRDPTSYKLYGSNDGSTWTLIKQDAISLSETRYWTSPTVDVANTTAYAYYFMLFPTTKAGDGCGQNCNSMQIAEITYYYDANSTATSTATSSTIVDPVTAAANTLCCGGSATPFSSNPIYNANTVAFVNRTTADSRVYIEQVGNANLITVNQSGTKNNYAKYYGNGSSNDISINQSGNASTTANYTDISLVGNSNVVSVTQQSTGGIKGAFITVNDSGNNIVVQQKDSGNHYAEVSVSGGNKSVDITQQGGAAHMASVTLTGPQPASLSLTQSGSTQQFYSITSNCTTVGGCARITVNQGQ